VYLEFDIRQRGILPLNSLNQPPTIPPTKQDTQLIMRKLSDAAAGKAATDGDDASYTDTKVMGTGGEFLLSLLVPVHFSNRPNTDLCQASSPRSSTP